MQRPFEAPPRARTREADEVDGAASGAPAALPTERSERRDGGPPSRAPDAPQRRAFHGVAPPVHLRPRPARSQ